MFPAEKEFIGDEKAAEKSAKEKAAKAKSNSILRQKFHPWKNFIYKADIRLNAI